MARFKTIAALLAIGVAAGACNSHQYGLSAHRNPSITSVNEPVVERTDYVFDANATGSGLAYGEAQRLDAWLSSLGLGYGDRVAIDQAGYADMQSRAQIADIAGRYGVLLAEGAPVTAGAVQPGSVRVVVSRSLASVPGCPIWNHLEVGARVTTAPNYGCSTNSNLAAMIADPNDLVLGQTGSAGGDVRTASKAIKQYRDAPPTGARGLQQTSTTERSQ